MTRLARLTQLDARHCIAPGVGDFFAAAVRLAVLGRVSGRFAHEASSAGLFAQGIAQHLGFARLGAVDVIGQRRPSVSSQFKRSVMRPAQMP